MPAKTDKVIVTNLTALRAKYGTAGANKIKAAVKALIKADKERGMTTLLLAVDQAADMKKVKAPAVSSATDPAQNKNTVDAIYKALAPDYVVILGAADVIPHQDLKSPTFSPPDDPDQFAFGDIPYACETTYSQNAQDFFGPTRVVSRLPDVQGGNDPTYLVGLLKTATGYKSGDPASYLEYFGISAQIWKGSTALSLTNTFGDAAAMKTVPQSTAQWPAAELHKLSHFINCHGAPRNQHFFGQPASGAAVYPPALDAAYLDQKISAGTVAAAECCYGAQLYNPHANHFPICNTYLGNGAFAFFGSTTIAYGPSDGNDQADLLCQFFLQSMLQGASLGRAALEARQKFVQKTSMSDPSNVKTIAQFNLYGDASLTPVTIPHAVVLTAAKRGAKGAAPLALRVERAERRRDLFSRGLALAKSQPTIRRSRKAPRRAAQQVFARTAKAHGITSTKTLTFEVRPPSINSAMPKAMAAKNLVADRVHMCFGTVTDSPAESSNEVDSMQVVRTVALILKEVDGEIVSATKIFAK